MVVKQVGKIVLGADLNEKEKKVLDIGVDIEERNKSTLDKLEKET